MLRFRSTWLLIAAILAADGARAQVPYLVADLNPPHEAVPGSNPRGFVALGTRSLFFATSDRQFHELWATDGTAAGTHRIEFPCVIYCDTAPTSVQSVLGVREGIAFLAVGEADPVFYESREHLWRTDGTQAGTRRLTAVEGFDYLYPDGGVTSTPVVLDDRFYFAHRREGGAPLELWSSDGSESGTTFVAELDPGASATPAAIVPVGDELFVFLQISEPIFHFALWKSDGTGAGTAGIESFIGAFNLIDAAIPTPSFLYFSALTPIDGNPNDLADQLWVTDGRPGGTRRLTSFPRNWILPLAELKLDAGRLLFFAADAAGISQAWRSDGTLGGTYALSAFSSPQMSYFRHEPPPIADLDGVTYFLGFGADDALALWRSEGSPGAATRVLRLDQPNYDGNSEMVWLERFGDRLLLPARGANGWELHASDGSRAGTRELADLCPGECDGWPSRPRMLGDRIFFEATDSWANRQLWTADLPEMQASQLTVPPARTGHYPGFFPPEVVRVPTGWLFAATDATHGFELWRSDGTPEDAQMVVDLRRDRPGLSMANLEPDGSELFFSAYAEYRNLFEVVKTDATPAGTEVLSWAPSFNCGIWSHNSAPALYALPAALLIEEDYCDEKRIVGWDRATGDLTTLFGGREPPNAGYAAVLLRNGVEALVERVNEIPWESQLWRTDGTLAGTRLLRPMPEPLQISSIQLTLQGKALYTPSWPSPALRALDLATYEDGEVVTFALPAAPDYRIYPVGELGFFFVRVAPYLGEIGAPLELWRTTGSPAGTFPVARWIGGYQWPGAIVDLGGTAIVQLTTVAGTTELWRSDGTLAGTGMLSSFPILSSDTPGLERLGNSLFFRGYDAEHGEELWRTDGTATGTALFVDLAPGPVGSEMPWSTAGTRYLYFSAAAPGRLPALWVSDGTTLGTRQVAPQWEAGPAAPVTLATSAGGEQLYFSSLSPESGFELWRLDAGSGHLSLVADIWPGPSSSSPQDFIALGDVLLFTADDGVHGRELWALPPAGTPCVASGTRVCLHGDRFAAELTWSGGAAAPARELSDRTAAFSLPDGSRLDAVVKIVDGTAVNAHHWLFGASLVDDGFRLRVTDSAVGSVKEIVDPPGHLASFGEIEAFASFPPPTGTVPGFVSGLPGGGTPGYAPSPAHLCLGDGRFSVAARALDFFGASHDALVSPIDFGSEEGAFWLFDPAAIELVVRLSVSPEDGRVALAVAAMTNLGYEVIVTDLLSGATAVVEAPLGRFLSQASLDLFPGLP